MGRLLKFMIDRWYVALGVLVLLGVVIVIGKEYFRESPSEDSNQIDQVSISDDTGESLTDSMINGNSQDFVDNSKVNVTASPIPSPAISLTTEEGELYNYYLYSLNFVDENNGWVIQFKYNQVNVQDSTNLIRTKDGGKHFEAYKNNDFLLQKVSFINSEAGWALAMDRNQEMTDGVTAKVHILKTVDGGIHWEVQHSFDSIYGDNLDIQAINDEIIQVIINGIMYHSKDGGSSWIKSDATVKDFSAEHLEFVSAKEGWVSGVVKSSDLTDQSQMIESDTLMEPNYTVYILHTTDGGDSWSEQFSKEYPKEWNKTIGISFADSQNGWMLTCNYGTFNGELYHTANGGSQWEKVNEIRVCRPYAQDVEAVTEDSLFIPFNHGAGPIDGGLFYSPDGGKTYNYMSTEDGISNSNGINFITPTLGYAILDEDNEKDLMKTEDGGMTWVKLDLNK
ncbi:MAG: hypothetical protein QM644_02440 [Mobilitalea sp.]